jgi:hypothetical protein
MARILQNDDGTSGKHIDCIRSMVTKIKESDIHGHAIIVVVFARANLTIG